MKGYPNLVVTKEQGKALKVSQGCLVCFSGNLQLHAQLCVNLSLQKSLPHFTRRVGAVVANRSPFTHQLANHMCPNSFVWEGHPEAPKEGVEKRMPHLQIQLIQFCIGGYSTSPDAEDMVHARPVWGVDVDAVGVMDENGEEIVETLSDGSKQPSALVYINMEPEPFDMYVQCPFYARNVKTVPGYGALVVRGDSAHGMMTVPAPAAGEIRPLRLVLLARLRSVWVSKERSQMTYEAPMWMEDPCVYNPYHMLPWVDPEDASRNIGNNMKSVYATLQGGGYSNCWFASHHALNLICQSEVIRLAPARLDNRPNRLWNAEAER